MLCPILGSSGPSHGDEKRKAMRSGLVLEDGRRVTETTSQVRTLLLARFESWLNGHGMSGDQQIFSPQADADSINKLLVRYGKWLFSEGKPYYHYSETINGIASKRPVLRRALQQAWDLAFVWGSHEPAEHHIAMPYQILIAMISAAWFWGWTREAAVLALSWGALLRIGEVLAAFRADLLLPSDISNTNNFALLRIKEPKTRFRAARHQAGKLEQPDLLEIVRLGFERLKPWEKLWNMSGATLRSRFAKLLAQLGLPIQAHEFPKPLSLASLRPGGATYMITVSENAELVRRRGRWASFKIMEIYLQEVAASTYLTDISKSSRETVMQGLQIFPTLLLKVRQFDACRIPATTWFFLLSQQIETDVKFKGGNGWQT